MGLRGTLRPVSVAPMMDRTDRHFRTLLRHVTRRSLLYTEMVTTGAILHGDRSRLLGFGEVERPLALQLGGDDPRDLAVCARIGEDLGHDEINLNVGCPSDRVSSGGFGACLMATPEVVAEGVAAMRAAVSVPVTVKHRIGIDDIDRYEDMLRFVDVVAAAGCDRFTVHARKAWLQGLSAKANREVPPLRYEEVWRLKRERPGLVVEINGGIRSLTAIRDHLEHVDAVMLGRAVVDDPMVLAEVDAAVFGDTAGPALSRVAIAEAMIPYLEERARAGEPPGPLLRPMLNLFVGVPGARHWRRLLSEGLKRGAGAAGIVRGALRVVAEVAGRGDPGVTGDQGVIFQVSS